jgi:hypothetical protein
VDPDRIKEAAGGATLSEIVRGLFEAIDAD